MTVPRIPVILGPILWISSVQYFVVQILVARAWTTPFSLIRNPISDLGNTACGPYAGRLVCSPLHAFMNGSFVVFGIVMIIGSWLVKQRIHSSPVTNWGFASIALAGLGTILVGFFPENINSVVHVFGASFPFVFGNLGMLLLGLDLREIPVSLKAFTLVSGAVGTAALFLFFSHTYLGLGEGGMERITSYPLTIWMIVFGIYLLRSDLIRQ